MRVHHHAACPVEQADSRARFLGGIAQRFFVLRRIQRNAVANVGLDETADQDRLVAHVALQRAEELSLVEVGELEPRDRDQHDDEIDDQ